MGIAARLDFASRRNEARTITLRFVGVDWSGATMRQQVRLENDTPGEPLIDLGIVTSGEGIKIIGVTTENGAPVTTATITYNMTTLRDDLPFSGELGADSRFVHAFQVGGVTRLYGDWWALASAIDSETAPLDRPFGYGTQQRAPQPFSTAALTIVGQDVYEVSIDGVGLLAPLVVQAEAAAEEAATTAAGLAASLADLQSLNALRDTIFEKTRNLFDGIYRPWRVDGSIPGPGVLYNDTPTWRTAIVPVQEDLPYYVKVADPAMANVFRIAVHTEQFPEFDNVGAVALTEYVYREDTLDEHGFTSPITGWAFISVSSTGAEPRLQVEQGTAPTDYILPQQVVAEGLPKRVADAPDRLDDIFDAATARTRNLFTGEFRVFAIGGIVGSLALAESSSNLHRTAWAPIEDGKTYTIKVAPEADSFKVAVHTSLPPDLAPGQSRTLTDLLEFNDILTEYTFTAELDGFVMVNVSNTGQSPRVQIEEGSVATGYVPYFVAKPEFVEETIANSGSMVDVREKCACALERLDQNMLFPTAANVSMTGTDPGARFVEYFDGKMWGFTFLNGDISYSTDEGQTWTVRTNLTGTPPGVDMQRLLPTSDGEVVLMTASGVFKSTGWTGSGSVTWSANKVSVTSGATLFQFAFDGDGTKFVLAEYAAGTANWQYSRKVWISTDEGDTFAVKWDSLTQHGAPTNAQTHLHGVVYDRFSDRFYISEGHGPKGGLYCSDDDGATWLRAPGYHNGVLKSENVWPEDGDTNGPTVLVATSTGLVMGSDNENNGMFGLVRKPDPMDELVRWIYKEPINGAGGVAMFAIRGFLDEISDTAYVAFRSERDNQPPIICAGNPTEAGLVFRHPVLPVVGQSDQFGAIVKTADDKLVAYAQFAGNPFTLRGDLTYPSSGIQAIIRAELRKLELIP